MNRRILLLVATLAVAALALVAARDRVATTAYGVDVALRKAHPKAPTVLFVVLDTTRADHTSVCGYDRPTTPTLERLKAEGAAVSCLAETPGDWTLPTHASYFTGLTTTEHGAHMRLLSKEQAEKLGARWTAAEATKDPQRWVAVPLDARFQTMAQAFGERGYQTAMVSANRVLKASLGFARGFDTALWPAGPPAPDNQQYPGDPTDPAELLPVLSGLDRDKPLFLFVNFFFSHEPWGAVPDGVGWVPPRPPLGFRFEDDDGAWARLLTGRMTGQERQDYEAHLRDVYDWGLRRNDDGLDRLLVALKDAGWLEGGLRLAIVGDHGELLGEHDLLQHGGFLYEEDTNVPMLWMDSSGTPALPPGRISALEVYDFLLDGKARAERRPVVAHAFPLTWAHRFGGRFTERQAAIWDGDRKLLWREGTYEAYDLAADPHETTPLPVTEEERARLDVEAKAVEAGTKQVTEVDPKVIEALRATGYLD